MTSPALSRVIAAIQHARVMMFRDESDEVIDAELEKLADLGTGGVSLEEEYATAIELLASLPSDQLEALLASVENRRAS